MHNWALFYLVLYVLTTYMEKVLSWWGNLNFSDPSIYMTERAEVVKRVWNYKSTGQVLNYKDAEVQKFSHRLKKIVRVEIVPAQEHF